jgi:hypothetical protein
MNTKEIIAVFDSDLKLVDAISRLKAKGIPIVDAYTPFPVHGVLKQLGKESKLPFFSVFAGIATIVMVLSLLYYITVIDYPLNIGGKPNFALPSFTVIIYLATILLTFISTVVVFQIRTGLYPGKPVEVNFPESTDDKFVLRIGGVETFTDKNRAEAVQILTDIGAVDIKDHFV